MRLRRTLTRRRRRVDGRRRRRESRQWTDTVWRRARRRCRCRTAQAPCGRRCVHGRVDRGQSVRSTQTHDRQLPFRQRERQDRQGEDAAERQCPDQVAQGGGRRGAARTTPRRPSARMIVALTTASASGSHPTGRCRDRHDYAPVRRAWSISRASRSSSRSERRVSEASSSAEIACSAEPSKKVCRTCRSAVCLASFAPDRRQIDVPRPILLVPDVSLVFQDPQHRADG